MNYYTCNLRMASTWCNSTSSMLKVISSVAFASTDRVSIRIARLRLVLHLLLSSQYRNIPVAPVPV